MTSDDHPPMPQTVSRDHPNHQNQPPVNPVRAIAVVGAGTMGAGIAQLAAQRGTAVRLIDVSRDAVDRGLAAITQQLNRLVDKQKLPRPDRDAALARIQTAAAIAPADLADVQLAIEAVVENLDVKHRVFAELERATPPSCVLATNTSSLSVSRIAETLRDPARAVGMHFFNPAPLMPLVEVIAGARSAPTAVEIAFQTAKFWGKTPVRARDVPGFIVNRVARGFYLEALRLLDEGVAGVDEIDNVLRALAGFRMGPFELMDLIGVDINLAVSTSVWEQLGRPPRLAPHDIQRRLVAEGNLGRKTKRGFYAYDGEHKWPAVPVARKNFRVSPGLAAAVRNFCVRGGMAGAGATEQLILARILGAILNEAGLALGEGVATGGDIDTAMILGTNYPKGPISWADEIGDRNVLGVLKAFNVEYGDGRYEAAEVYRT